MSRDVTPVKNVVRVYKPLHTAALFHADDSFCRAMMGPKGCGKSVACGPMEIMMRAQDQRPAPDGVRYTRWAVIRDSYPNLVSTTLKTFTDWIPEMVCHVTKDTPITAKIQRPLPDGTSMDCEVIFLAIESLEDIEKKIPSLELTGAYLNEARTLYHREIMDIAGAVGRYPPPHMGGGAGCWNGIWMDANPTDDDAWFYQIFEIEKPPRYRLFRQPAVGHPDKDGNIIQAPDAEIPPGYDINYWQNMAAGKSLAWISVFIEAKYGSSFTGKPVWPKFVNSVHCPAEGQPLEPMRGLPLILGFDWGRTPTCVIGQIKPQGGVMVLDEVCTEDKGVLGMAREDLKPLLANRYPGMELIIWGELTGNTKSQTDDSTCFDMLYEVFGVRGKACRTNDLIPRLEAVDRLLMQIGGVAISTRCVKLLKALRGGYCYTRVRSAGGMWKDEPEDNEYTHVADAFQAFCMGTQGGGAGGQGRDVRSVRMVYRSTSPEDEEASARKRLARHGWEAFQ